MGGLSLYQNELMTGTFYPRVVTYYYRQFDGFHMPVHRHDQVEIMYIINGQCRVDVDSEEVRLKKGDLIVLDANVPHRLTVGEDHPCRIINVEFTFVEKKSALPSIKDIARLNPALTALLSQNKSFFVLKDSNDIYQTLKSLVFELDSQNADSDVLVHLLFSTLLIRLSRLAEESGETGTQPTDVYVKNVIAYLHHNYDQDIQVRNVACAVNLHPGYLHRIFKSHVGCTVIEYLTSLRVEKAKMLLTHTDIPVTEISDSVGINSSQYFSSVFKRHVGMTPLEYRKSMRGRPRLSKKQKSGQTQG